MMEKLTFCFKGRSDAKSLSKEIERQLHRDKKRTRSQVKLLVLGTAESGKSTFLKQMRIIHGNGYSHEDKKDYISLIHQNTNVSVKVLALGMEKLGITYEHPESQIIGERFTEMTRDEELEIDGEKAEEIIRFWKDAGVQKCYLRRNEFHLLDSASYYLSDISRISGESYVPTLQDILRTRLPTSGIVEYLFNVDRFVFGIVDVGGQKSERRKWIHCFENVTSIIFLAALSEYDQTIPPEEIEQDARRNYRVLNSSSGHTYPPNNNYHRNHTDRIKLDKSTARYKNPHRHAIKHSETGRHYQSAHHARKKGQYELPPFPVTNSDSYESNSLPRKHLNGRKEEIEEQDDMKINRLEESCALFKAIVQNPVFKNMSVILFLNKTDLLEEKIMHSHLVDHFPDFPGPKQDVEAAKDFISETYGGCFDEVINLKRTMYTHFTCATDTDNIKVVFAAVKDIILQWYLVNYNLV